MTTRKLYSKEFKLDAISLVLEQGYSRAHAARSLEINPNMLGRWIKEHESVDGQAFRGNGKLTAEQLESGWSRWPCVIPFTCPTAGYFLTNIWVNAYMRSLNALPLTASVPWACNSAMHSKAMGSLLITPIDRNLTAA